MQVYLAQTGWRAGTPWVRSRPGDAPPNHQAKSKLCRRQGYPLERSVTFRAMTADAEPNGPALWLSGIAVWYRDFLDPQLAVLLGSGG